MLTGAVDGHVHLFVADVIKSFDTVDRSILDCAWVGWVCLVGFGKSILLFMLMYGLGLSLLQGWAKLGPEMVVFLRDAL